MTACVAPRLRVLCGRSRAIPRAQGALFYGISGAVLGVFPGSEFLAAAIAAREARALARQTLASFLISSPRLATPRAPDRPPGPVAPPRRWARGWCSRTGMLGSR